MPGEDPRLEVEGLVVGELRYHDVGEQSRAWQSLVDRLDRSWGGGKSWNGVIGGVGGAAAGGAGVGVPHPYDDEHGGRAVVELLTRLGPDPDPWLAAARARLLGLGQVDLGPLAGKMVGQRAATVTAPAGGPFVRRDRRGCR